MSAGPTRVAVNGATGRTGSAVVEAAVEREDVDPVVGFASEAGEVAGVPVVGPDGRADALAEHDLDAVIDFSLPEASLALIEDLTTAGSDAALVVATTGFDEEGLAALEVAADDRPVLKAANFSRGVQALLRAVDEAVAALPGYDLELVETHHDGKVDAPSGTAGAILETIRERRDVEPVYGREGHAPREDDEVGVFARRAGDVRGEHELLLADNDEALTLTHRAEDRGVFAAGALDAATWLDGRDPGRYEFDAVVDAT